MGVGTLNNRSAGQTILDTFFNDIHGALDGDFVGRDTNGVAAASQNLGTAAYPWGTIRAQTLVLNGSSVDTSKLTSPVNRVISGKIRASSNQPAFITPNGAAASFILKAATTNLLVDINGTTTTFNTDITKSSLTVAPSSQNTCTVNDSTASGQADTRLWGEYEHTKKIIVTSMGTNITAKVGSFAAFKIGSEYFIALVESTTLLSHARRGYFFDSSLNPMNRSTFSNSATITLMSWGHVFVDIDTATVDISYNPPTWSGTAPASPATGDYWYDLVNNLWKRYDGAQWVIINRTYVGSVIIDTANCVGARCQDFYALYDEINTLNLEVSTTEIAIATKANSEISVAGKYINFVRSLPKWNITTNLAGSTDMYNATEQASTNYYYYLKDDGNVAISDISPYYRDDLLGPYHPHNPWRCVGIGYNDGSSNIIQAGGFTTDSIDEVQTQLDNGYGSGGTFIRRWTNNPVRLGGAVVYLDDSTNGGNFTVVKPGKYSIHYCDEFSDTTSFGISLNSTQLSTSLASITQSTILAHASAAASNLGAVASVTVNLKIGDVIRAHVVTVRSAGTSTWGDMFRMTRVA